ncbi:MAG: hypothetical protein CO150_04215 [Nitrospirae bacterium CG_4_9_14_3_um_filter_53_35]|nr:MAG: hypothetical protein AUK29_01080 [Nitrospirae bacterium CG2_30_53_67]PIS37387.1 MAG: hypothetical protein COT35_06340 [Nitrospirae bacterium CG08_land_8_20_14_0_20_52_24]PIV82771.1 MAG: hypothetical protein COW52_11865 [Nitrospirae bacterium CG17_big_fil_post_rev_8_21_14_2_50_50_9]PIW85388.1 MAG: hypothetical protein COZ95_04735 [Nitrospirae bacterium CG_4_8_14_3_um_filter_50_41]PIX85338.1 MAG: hypothetical protein COZ32_09065 [Nitrospirae bacterium CG_4_10_14_3_um_filter_53_41]PJA7588
MLILKMIVTLIIFLGLLFFANQNSTDVSIYYGMKGPIQLPLFLAILISFLAGMIIALFISYIEKFKLKGQIRALRREKKAMEGELNSLRRMPILESMTQRHPEEIPPDEPKGIV